MDVNEARKELDMAVCNAMVSSTPDNWSVIVLKLERYTESAIGDISFSLSSPEGHPPVMPADVLFEAGGKLDEFFAGNGKRFTKATYQVDLAEDSWSWKAEFEFGPTRANPMKNASLRDT